MFCSIRRYDECTDVKELQNRIEREILPTIRDMPGFHGYQLVDCHDGEVLSISQFDTEDQADDANGRVKEIVQKELSDLIPESPEIMIGEILIDSQ